MVTDCHKPVLRLLNGILFSKYITNNFSIIYTDNLVLIIVA